jgi:uncharacterized protein (TIGR03437 family)
MTRIRTYLFVLGLVLGAHVARGQAVSIVRRLSGSQPFESAVAITRDATGLYALTTAAARKLDSTGAVIWMRPVSDSRGVAGNGSGIYVTGVTSQALSGEQALGLIDVFVQRYDSDGNVLWTRQFGTAGDDDVRGIAADTTGVYLAGLSVQSPPVGYLRKYDPLGNLLWAHSSPAAVQSIAVSGDSVYIALIASPAGMGRSLAKYNADGTELWTKDFGNSAFFSTITASSAGVFAAGIQLPTASSNSYPFIARYDSDGAELWNRPILGVSPGQPFGPFGLAADADGVYFAANGTIPSPCPSGGQDQIVLMYSVDGAEVWRMQFGSYGEDQSAGIASDENGLTVLGTHAEGVVLATVAKRAEAVSALIPKISWGCVLNAASLIGGAIVPGEIVTVLGAGMGPEQAVKADLSTGIALGSLAGVRVLFNGIAAPLLMVSGERITAIVPHAVEVGSAVDVHVEYQGVRSSPMTLPVQSSRIGLFSQNGLGTGAGAVLNQDGSINSPSNPAERGTIISLYATGGGPTDKPIADGMIVASPPPNLTSSVYAALNPVGDIYVDDSDYAEVVFAGLVSDSVDGLVQVNIKLDGSITPGIRSLHVVVGSDPYSIPFPAVFSKGNEVTIAVR